MYYTTLITAITTFGLGRLIQFPYTYTSSIKYTESTAKAVLWEMSDLLSPPSFQIPQEFIAKYGCQVAVLIHGCIIQLDLDFEDIGVDKIITALEQPITKYSNLGSNIIYKSSSYVAVGTAFLYEHGPKNLIHDIYMMPYSFSINMFKFQIVSAIKHAKIKQAKEVIKQLESYQNSFFFKNNLALIDFVKKLYPIEVITDEKNNQKLIHNIIDLVQGNIELEQFRDEDFSKNLQCIIDKINPYILDERHAGRIAVIVTYITAEICVSILILRNVLGIYDAIFQPIRNFIGHDYAVVDLAFALANGFLVLNIKEFLSLGNLYAVYIFDYYAGDTIDDIPLVFNSIMFDKLIQKCSSTEEDKLESMDLIGYVDKVGAMFYWVKDSLHPYGIANYRERAYQAYMELFSASNPYLHTNSNSNDNALKALIDLGLSGNGDAVQKRYEYVPINPDASSFVVEQSSLSGDHQHITMSEGLDKKTAMDRVMSSEGYLQTEAFLKKIAEEVKERIEERKASHRMECYKLCSPDKFEENVNVLDQAFCKQLLGELYCQEG